MKKRPDGRLLLLSALLAWLTVQIGLAQSAASGGYWTAAVHWGTVWRHTPKLTVQTGQPVAGYEIGYRWQTGGQRAWHVRQRFPGIRCDALFFNLGKNTHDAAVGVLPSLDIPLLRHQKFQGWFNIGTGLAWVTKPYDFIQNPDQNAIGSHLNNLTRFGLLAEWRFNEHFTLGLTGTLTHLSNGAAALPNYGLNLPTTAVFARYKPKSAQTTRPISDFQPVIESEHLRRWSLNAYGGIARIEYNALNGPKYYIWQTGGGIGWQPGFNQRLGLDLEYEYNDAVYQFYYFPTTAETQSTARKASSRWSIALSDEFLFGPIAIRLQAGAYLGFPGYNLHVPDRFYSRLGLRYYIPVEIGRVARPFVGVSLKAHYAIAEYFNLTAGLLLSR